MTNQEAIGILRRAVTEVEWEYPMEIAAAIDKAIEVLRAGWISVKDRLPEEKVWVLCLCRAGIREVLRWQNEQWYHDPQHAYFESFVLYWMQLPEPPKEET